MITSEQQQPAFMQNYIEGFSRCYPHKTVEVKPVWLHKTREFKFSVIINQERGDMLLTEEQLRSAARGFNAGVKHVRERGPRRC